MEKDYIIKINAKFGSDFQEELFDKALEGTLKAQELAFKSSHKKNKINMELHTISLEGKRATVKEGKKAVIPLWVNNLFK